MTSSGISLIVLLLFLLISVVIYTLLIMVIWNNVLVPKVKGADLQKLDFWNALAIGIFFSLVSGGTTVIQKS